MRSRLGHAVGSTGISSGTTFDWQWIWKWMMVRGWECWAWAWVGHGNGPTGLTPEYAQVVPVQLLARNE